MRIRTIGGNISVIVPRGHTAYNIHTSSVGGSVSDSVPQSTSGPNGITASTIGGDITITEAS